MDTRADSFQAIVKLLKYLTSPTRKSQSPENAASSSSTPEPVSVTDNLDAIFVDMMGKEQPLPTLNSLTFLVKQN